MIKGFVQGQTLRLAQTRVVADSIDYLIAKFHFQGEDWRGLEKWMHLQQGEQLYVIQLIDDHTQKSDHLNLSAGEWAVWLHGNVSESGSVMQRITTNICTFTVEQSGALEGDAMPELPASIGEQLQARIAVLEANEGGLPVIGENDEGKVLTAVDGAWEPREIEIASAVTVDSALSETSENPVQNKVITQIVQEANAAMTELGSTIDILSAHATPSVSTADNGKFLQVVDGAWAAADAPGAGASITVDNELSETSENPVQNKVITQTMNAFAEGVEQALANVSSTVPTFNLVNMGLPTVEMNGTQSLKVETSDILAALEKGPAKFILSVNLGMTVEFGVVMNSIGVTGQQGCTCLAVVGDAYLLNLTFTLGEIVANFIEFERMLLPLVVESDSGKLLQVVDNKWTPVSVADSAVKTYIDEYINEALGGDY